MPGNFEGRLKVHPTILDAALHVTAIHVGVSKGDPTEVHPYMPVYLERLFILSSAQHTPELCMDVYAFDSVTPDESRSTRVSLMICLARSDIPLIEMDRLESTDVHESDIHQSPADKINPHKIVWLYHPDYVTMHALAKPSTTTEAEQLASYHNLAVSFITEAMQQEAVALRLPDAEHLHSWMSKALNETVPVSKVVEFGHTSTDSSYSILLQRGSKALPSLSLGDTLPSLDDSTVPRSAEVLTHFLGLGQTGTCLIGLVGHLACIQPSMKILEVSAGVNGLTHRALEAMTATGGSSRFRQYDYTDLSSESFSRTQEQLVAWDSKLEYLKLDLSKDLGQQGFDLGSYDLIFGSLASYPAAELSQCLRNLERLLKPNGCLALMGLDSSSPINLPMMLLLDQGYKDSHTVWLSESQWSATFLDHGFSRPRYWESANGRTVWTMKGAPESVLREKTTPTPIALIASSASRERALAVQGTLLAEDRNRRWSPVIQSPEEAVDFSGTLICFEDPWSFNLASADEKKFAAVHQMLLAGKSIIWVTSADYSAAEETCMSAFALGFGRVMRAEDATRRFVVLQTDPSNDDPTDLAICLEQILMYELANGPGKSDLEYEWRQDGRRVQVPRLLPDSTLHDGITRLSEAKTTTTAVKLSDGATSISATCDQPGAVSSLHYAVGRLLGTSEDLGDYEVLLRVEAVGVNFKDLLITLGRVPWELPGKECSGVVLAAGRHALHAPGDRVAHWGDGLFADVVRCHTDSISAIPDFMTMEEAASIPIVFAMAYECLVNVARLEAGERVLIHAASGGVGQAAIMIAQWIGAEVYCTVSTPEKMSLVMSRFGVPATRIFSSRSPMFAKELMAQVKGEGVDVVINSVSGEMLKATWSCMATQGRFIEIGKRDALVNNTLDMGPFAKGVSYSAVDLSLTISNKPKPARQLLDKVMDLFKDRQRFRPVHPFSIYPAGEVHEALRKMQTGKHVGKLIVSMAGEEVVQVRHHQSAFDKDACYVITGGTGGLGRSLVRRMISRGARNIQLLSRSGASVFATAIWEATLTVAREQMAFVTAHACDITSLQDVRQTLEAMTAEGTPPVKGVIHGAMVLRVSVIYILETSANKHYRTLSTSPRTPQTGAP